MRSSARLAGRKSAARRFARQKRKRLALSLKHARNRSHGLLADRRNWQKFAEPIGVLAVFVARGEEDANPRLLEPCHAGECNAIWRALREGNASACRAA